VLYDWIYIAALHRKIFEKQWFDSWGYLAQLWLIPGMILLLGGYFVRKLPPASRFGVMMIAVSVLAALFNVVTIGCYELASFGGACT